MLDIKMLNEVIENNVGNSTNDLIRDIINVGLKDMQAEELYTIYKEAVSTDKLTLIGSYDLNDFLDNYVEEFGARSLFRLGRDSNIDLDDYFFYAMNDGRILEGKTGQEAKEIMLEFTDDIIDDCIDYTYFEKVNAVIADIWSYIDKYFEDGATYTKENRAELQTVFQNELKKTL